MITFTLHQKITSANQKIVATNPMLKIELHIKSKTQYHGKNPDTTPTTKAVHKNPWEYWKQKQSHCCNWGKRRLCQG